MQLDKTGNTANRPRQESSLVWRYGKLGPAKEAVNTLEEADYGHGVFRRTYEMEEMIEIKEESIRQRDVLGKKVLANNFDLMNPDGQIEEFGLLSWPVNPFVEYLCHLAKETGNETIRIVGEDDDEETSGVNWAARSIMGSLVDFSINANELDRLVDDNVWAARALKWGCVQIKDIPEELLGDETLEERVDWLAKQIPKDRHTEYEAYWDDLRKSIGINLDDDGRENEDEN